MKANTQLEVLENILKTSKIRFVFLGNKAIAKMDTDKVAEVMLSGSGTRGHWDGLGVTIKHKDNGDISFNKFSFEQYLGKDADRGHPNTHIVKNMYIWMDYAKLDWYIVYPTNLDPILMAISDFINFYKNNVND